MLLLFIEKVRASFSVILGIAILGIVVLGLRLELSACQIANNKAHSHANEADATNDDKNDAKRRSILFDALHDLMLAVAIDRDAIANVREKVVAAIRTETSALPVSLQDLENWVVLGTLGTVHDTVEVGALVKPCRSELICHHFLLHFCGENARVGIAGAFIRTEHFLSS